MCGTLNYTGVCQPQTHVYLQELGMAKHVYARLVRVKLVAFAMFALGTPPTMWHLGLVCQSAALLLVPGMAPNVCVPWERLILEEDARYQCAQPAKSGIRTFIDAKWAATALCPEFGMELHAFARRIILKIRKESANCSVREILTRLNKMENVFVLRAIIWILAIGAFLYALKVRYGWEESAGLAVVQVKHGQGLCVPVFLAM